MKIFGSLYDKVMRWSKHRKAPYYLAGLSFAESSFFPVPPDVMLMPMVLAKPERAWWYAGLTTLASVAGGIMGYLIGHFALELVNPLIQEGGHWAEKFQRVSGWFEEWGFWAILMAGFSPIPYKIFTISAGVLSMAFLPFVIASFIGRGGRFFLEAGLLRLGGESMERNMRKHIDTIGWVVVVLIILVVYFLKT
ncbi:MAG: YqaA family protein [Gammaproteobacteria bacterium]